MTIQWHLTTGPHVDVLQISGYLGDDAVTRFNGAIGWAFARGEQTLLLDCTRLKGWSPAGRDAITTAAQSLARQQRALELITPPTSVEGIRAHTDLDAALAHHQATAGEQTPDREQTPDAWHSTRWDTDTAP
ncbi:STAS domain-containing protein [Streptacidiphilus rugosus]|uniref:hypothetical protein n=1 Tax=Streptacidiphilus rugosus TaxID=405783 RepID=UPI0006909E83|nr:hypothetical protein [Streptacidiphilus rugosus]